jgi:3-oxoacyl-[acyl-carrier-protein] synthase II
MRRIVITGIGAVTPLANKFFDSWSLVKKGISGISRISKFDTTGLSWTIAGEIKGFNPELYLSKKEILKLDPFLHYAVAAATMAAEDAGLIEQKSEVRSQKSEPPLTKGGIRGGVIIGSSRGGITTIEKELQKLCSSRFTVHGSRLSPYLMPSTTISMAASYVAQKLGIKGHCLGISNACASGTNAIGEAYRLIKHGYADMVIAGGTEAPICMLCVEGYGAAGALSKNGVPRPFDKKRDGFVIAEGACIMALEEYESALKRSAKIYGEIIGYSNITDAFHITRPDIEGEIMAIKTAFEDAGISPDDVDYINAHGTSTPIGDITESMAIKKVFKDRAAQMPVTAIKSMTGHMLAASGAFEAACTAMSIKECIIPPTANITEKDHECGINVITEKKETDIKIAITNSFGFGGVNAVLVLKKLEN